MQYASPWQCLVQLVRWVEVQDVHKMRLRCTFEQICFHFVKLAARITDTVDTILIRPSFPKTKLLKSQSLFLCAHDVLEMFRGHRWTQRTCSHGVHSVMRAAWSIFVVNLLGASLSRGLKTWTLAKRNYIQVYVLFKGIGCNCRHPNPRRVR